jgi:hypothetical protein
MVEEIEIYVGYVIPHHIIINMLHWFQVLGLNVFFFQYFEVASLELTFIQIGGKYDVKNVSHLAIAHSII